MTEHDLAYCKASFTATAMVDLVALTAIAFVVLVIMVIVG